MAGFTFYAEKRNIQDIFEKNYIIPEYQRQYSWGDDEIEEFWEDNYIASSSGFIGSFIFNSEKGKSSTKFDVTDGQQRLLTIIIFLSVLRNISAKENIKDLPGLIDRFINHEDKKTGIQSYVVTCGKSTAPFFNKYVYQREEDIYEENPKRRKERENYQIRKNYLNFEAKVNNRLGELGNINDKSTLIRDLYARTLDIEAIEIIVESEESAYEIFETVNDRGVDLTVADLLKNRIFKKMKGSKDNAIGTWANIESNVLGTETEIKRFIRYYWMSKYADVTDRKLFKDIKDRIEDYDSFLSDLDEASKLFNKVLLANQEEWSDSKKNKEIWRALAGIKSMKNMISYIPLLSIFRNCTDLVTNKQIQIIEDFSLLYFTLCGLPANKVEKIFTSFSRKIEKSCNPSSRDKKKRKENFNLLFDELEQDLKKLIPNYSDINSGFNEMQYANSDKNTSIIRYLLSRINDAIIGKSNEYIINFNSVDIEHILPQKPHEEWKISKNQIVESVNRLGNLTLLSSPLNNEIKNRNIEVKLPEYKKSQLAITYQDLVKDLEMDKLIWNEESIEKRQTKLLKLLLKTVRKPFQERVFSNT